MLPLNQIDQYADHLMKAEVERLGAEPLTQLKPDFSVEDAYSVQLKTVERKVINGKVVTGKKIGLTSKAMQSLLGVEEPDYGHLLDDMEVINGGVISRNTLLLPRVEAEIGFVLKKDLIGPRVTVQDVLLATDYVIPVLEIVDSRVADWKIKIQDTVADNASSARYVLGGKPVKVDQIDLPLLGMAFYKNGELANTGVGAAVLGNPAYCVAWLANKLLQYGISLRAGEVILSGALSAAVSADAGDEFIARFAHLGNVSVRFGE